MTLDGRVTKTVYKDNLLIPSRSLAVAIAEEWEMQGERIDLKDLKLNHMLAKAVRASHDESLIKYMKTTIQNTLENDQICFQIDPLIQNEYKQKLAIKQQQQTKPLFDFMKQQFEISLKTWYNIPLDS